MDVESRFIAGPVGRLDSRWHGPAGGPPVLLLHPHPLFGGTMGSRLVYDLAVGLASAGMRVVRFDFRGVGRSGGEHGDGIGEVDDAAMAFDALAQGSVPGRPRADLDGAPAVVGYSFGGGVATRLATLRPVRRLVVIGTPPRTLRSALVPAEDAPSVKARTHLVVGDRDEHVSVAEAKEFAAAFRPPATLKVIAGAGHFLEPSRNADVLAAVLDALG